MNDFTPRDVIRYVFDPVDLRLATGLTGVAAALPGGYSVIVAAPPNSAEKGTWFVMTVTASGAAEVTTCLTPSQVADTLAGWAIRHGISCIVP